MNTTKIEVPSVVINGETIYASENMKMRVWREYLKATSEETDDTIASLIENAIKVIVIVFNNDKVTEETLDENLNVNEVVPLFKKCNEFLQGLTFGRLIESKNVEAEKAE